MEISRKAAKREKGRGRLWRHGSTPPAASVTTAERGGKGGGERKAWRLGGKKEKEFLA